MTGLNEAKSVSRTQPQLVTITFSGLMSPWHTLWVGLGLGLGLG